MAFTIAEELQRLGVSGPLANEYQKQLTTGPVSVPRLQASGVPTGLAVIVTNGITAGSVKRDYLTAASMNPVVAAFMAGEINTPPVNTVLPDITGTAQVGQTLNGSTGTWTSKSSITYSRAWLADGVVISGETDATYVPVTGDVGKTITERVTATNANGYAVAVSEPTAAVIAE